MTSAFVVVAAPGAQAVAPVPLTPVADTVAPTVPGGFGYSINCALVLTLRWTTSP